MNQPIKNLAQNKTWKVIFIILLVLSVIADVVLGILLYKKTKAYRGAQTIIRTKSNCEKCPAQVQETPPAETPSTTTTVPSTTKKRSTNTGTSSGDSTSDSSGSSGSSGETTEPVIPPPPPPSN